MAEREARLAPHILEGQKAYTELKGKLERIAMNGEYKFTFIEHVGLSRQNRDSVEYFVDGFYAAATADGFFVVPSSNLSSIVLSWEDAKPTPMAPISVAASVAAPAPIITAIITATSTLKAPAMINVPSLPNIEIITPTASVANTSSKKEQD